MNSIAFYQVDAFASQIFKGNPAVVCPLDKWLPDETLQLMTIEHNQSETAFFVPTANGYKLRWFTSLGEIDLCGHATLASAHVLFNHLNYPHNKIQFETQFVGNLTVTKDSWGLTLDFPSWPPEQLLLDKPIQSDIAIRRRANRMTDTDIIVAGLGGMTPEAFYKKRDYMFVFSGQEDIERINPDFKTLGQLKGGICITAPGNNCDFVSRFFCPGDAVEEDPVTGSAHSMLVPYWAERLGKNKLLARQVSKRGGELRSELQGDRVMISGQAQTYMSGTIFLP